MEENSKEKQMSSAADSRASHSPLPDEKKERKTTVTSGRKCFALYSKYNPLGSFARTKADLESEGYTVQPFIIPACAIRAPHRRDRVWIIAYRNSSPAQQAGCGAGAGGEKAAALQAAEQGRPRQAVFDYGCASVQGADDADTNQQGLERRIKRTEDRLQPTDHVFTPFWNGHYDELPQPIICRGDDGFSTRVDRLKALGNAVVPQIPEIIGQAIINSIKD